MEEHGMNRLTTGVALVLLLAGTLLTFGCAQHSSGTSASELSGGGSAVATTRGGTAVDGTTAGTSSSSTTSLLGQDSYPSGVSTARGDADTSAGAETTMRGGVTDSMRRGAHSPKSYRRVNGLRDIHFDFDQAEVRGDQQLRILEANARWMRVNPGAVLLIEGHADERGTNDYNLSLGERRAMSARNYLIAHGVNADRIATVSYGEERPVCRDHSEDCWSQNRWAHFLIRE
jgi:peptidoglycan-associated lipoprotein